MLKNKREVKEKLEVLVILGKKKVNIGYLYYLYCWYSQFNYNFNYDSCISYILNVYNDSREVKKQLTKRELVNILLWLEGDI